MKEQITANQARALVTQTGWNLMKRGYVTFGFENGSMCWEVYAAGNGIYYRKRCDPMW